MNCIRRFSRRKNIAVNSVQTGNLYCYSEYSYHPPLASVLKNCKYKKQYHYLPLMQRLIKQSYKKLPQKTHDIITFVPVSYRKFLQRGFNQSRIMAKAIARQNGIKFQQLLKRKHSALSQVKLDATQRKNNLRNNFTFLKNKDIRNKHILLVDDVLTTGTTVNTCADILLKEGASMITIITLMTTEEFITKK